MRVGERLRAIRAELKLTQLELARELGLSLRGWQALEANKNVPSGETLLKIASLGYSPTWILSGDEPKFLARGQQTDHLAEQQRATADASIKAAVEIGALIVKVYADEKITLPPSLYPAEIKRIFTVVLPRVSDPSDPEEWRSLMPWAENWLRKDLREAAAAPGTGKREAS